LTPWYQSRVKQWFYNGIFENEEGRFLVIKIMKDVREN